MFRSLFVVLLVMSAPAFAAETEVSGAAADQLVSAAYGAGVPMVGGTDDMAVYRAKEIECKLTRYRLLKASGVVCYVTTGDECSDMTVTVASQKARDLFWALREAGAHRDVKGRIYTVQVRNFEGVARVAGPEAAEARFTDLNR